MPSVTYLPSRSTSQSRPPRNLVLLPASEERRQSVPVAMMGFATRIAARMSASALLAHSNIPLAICSWVVAEFMAGCAAYARAMYLHPAFVEQHIEPHDSIARQRSPLPHERRRLRLVSSRTGIRREHAARSRPIE